MFIDVLTSFDTTSTSHVAIGETLLTIEVLKCLPPPRSS